ncbi:conserved hypothetical protein [Perkinsus marinus ATCC 50983]|uniref:ABC-2 type transporter transmembrane domain-containing protein n=1 Tax=Perkinsus marinus (strain ATCC 50983 / TXsc) TaxID=423536 RepID=C5KI88_PERM5|nr:conserved hypothetical protein [Perkinsus marinus ATCC 50983]EER15806.1 conserved hypothetical protein [Perkinsus marinus ATCC 50983]|eukprot:XP_002784010.1 conserved hypothetical protein [Perkinsus marinus ATCC 50983]
MPLILVPQMIFSGLFTPISEIPVWLRWLQYLSFLKYTGSLAYFNEFGFDMTLLNEANDIHADLVGLYIGVLLAMLIILRILATVILKRKARAVSPQNLDCHSSLVTVTKQTLCSTTMVW